MALINFSSSKKRVEVNNIDYFVLSWYPAMFCWCYLTHTMDTSSWQQHSYDYGPPTGKMCSVTPPKPLSDGAQGVVQASKLDRSKFNQQNIPCLATQKPQRICHLRYQLVQYVSSSLRPWHRNFSRMPNQIWIWGLLRTLEAVTFIRQVPSSFSVVRQHTLSCYGDQYCQVGAGVIRCV